MLIIIADLKKTLVRIQRTITMYLQDASTQSTAWDSSREGGHHCEDYGVESMMRRAYNWHPCGLLPASIFMHFQWTMKMLDSP
jgi:hypothetical protein